MLPHSLLSLCFPVPVLALLLHRHTRSHLLTSSKAWTQNITTCSISSLLSSLQQPEMTRSEWADRWAEHSALRAHWWEKEKKCMAGDMHRKPAWKQLWRLAKESFGQVDILHGGRLNTVPPPHCLLCNSNRGHKVFPQQGGAWPGAGRGLKKSESRLPGERPWQQEDQKKQEQILGQIVWSSGAGDNCILKISWGMGLE